MMELLLSMSSLLPLYLIGWLTVTQEAAALCSSWRGQGCATTNGSLPSVFCRGLGRWSRQGASSSHWNMELSHCGPIRV